MCHSNSRLILIVSLCACLSAHAQDAAPEPEVGIRFYLPRIILSGIFKPRAFPTTVILAFQLFKRELAIRHALEVMPRARHSTLLERLFFFFPPWKFIQKPGGPKKKSRNFSLFPLTISPITRQQDYEMECVKKKAQKIFER